MNFILTIALTQIIIAFYLLWNDFRKQSPEQFLLALLVVMFTHMATKFTLYVIINNQLLFNYTASSFSLGYGPLMFLYVQSKVSGHGSSRQRLFLHLGPFLAFTVFYGIVVATTLSTFEESLLKVYQDVVLICIMISTFGYMGYILFCFFKHPKKYAATAWLKYPITYLISVFIISFIYASISGNSDDFIFRYFAYSGFVYIALSILRHYVKNSRAVVAEKRITTAKYERSGLKKELASEIVHRLTSLMEKDKVYLNAELKLDELAELLENPKHHITEALNTELNKNFYHFVNEYRVKEAQHQLEQGFEDSIIQLAYASGFNSKTTFNTYFKKFTGQTPNEYRSSFLLKVNLSNQG